MIVESPAKLATASGGLSLFSLDATEDPPRQPHGACAACRMQAIA